jgi:ribosome recycling factor
MKKAVSVLADSFNTIRTGRANPAILDKIMVGLPGRRGSKVICKSSFDTSKHLSI